MNDRDRYAPEPTTAHLAADHLAGLVHLAEYTSLSTERRDLRNGRDALLRTNLAILAATLLLPTWWGSPYMLVAMTVISTALGWAYLCKGVTVDRISRYIRDHLTSYIDELAAASVSPKALFVWEFQGATDRDHRRGHLQLIVDLLAFVAPSLLCLGLLANSASRVPPIVVFLLLPGFLTFQIIQHTYLTPERRPARRAGTGA